MKKQKLVIVESPAKSNTISKYLGDDFVVSSSMGHVRDLNPNILSIDVDDNYRPHYEELKEKKQIIQKLKSLSKKSEMVLLAPDPDREGEAIAFHLREILKHSNENIYRIIFYEITPGAILDALKNPAEIDLDKVNSQQMRRVLDRLAGYKISPVLQKKMGGPLSAGRVQSITLKLIVEREKSIMEFVSEEFWSIIAKLEGSKKPQIEVKLEKYEGKKLKISNKNQSDEILENLNADTFILKSIKKRIKKIRPLPPLITSTLQQEAYKQFKFPVKKAMKVAQELYEGLSLIDGERFGLITYMRTDSYRIANDARVAAKKFITSEIGSDLYPEKPHLFGKKTKSQDAHEAIRPTLPLRKPDSLKQFLSDAQFKIYRLIWNRFLASQMKEARIEVTQYVIENGKYVFLISGEIVKFPGFFEIMGNQNNALELPDLKEGEELSLIQLIPKQNFTKPPARYTEATLVKTLEDKGIGRPSTYAKIIDTLGKREYVFREDRKFVPTLLGWNVVVFLEKKFKDLMNYNFTAELETQLDLVSEGKLDWIEGIDRYYKKLAFELESVKDLKKSDLYLEKKCPKCGKELLLKYSYKTKGWFVGCTGYPACKYTERINSEEKTVKTEEMLDMKCPRPECGQPLIKRYSSKTRNYFIGCSGYPRCNYIKTVKEDLGNCPQCDRPLTKKFSRKTRRYFIGCTGYPDCKYIGKKTKNE
jgi:DNA topoisomerase-1